MCWIHVSIAGLAWLILTQQVTAAPTAFELTDNPDLADFVVTIYNPTDGMVTVQGNNVTMAAYQLESTSGMFIPENADAGFCVGAFDVCTDTKFFTLRTGGVSELTLGQILRPNMMAGDLIEDLTTDFATPPGCHICVENPKLYIVPEPSSGVLLLIGACPRRPRRSRSAGGVVAGRVGGSLGVS